VRVGVVTTSYPRFPGDAAGSFVAGHVAWLLRAGHQVEVIAADDPDHRVRDPDSESLRVVRVPAPPGLFYRGGAPDAVEAGGHRAAAAHVALALAAAVLRAGRRWDATCAHWLAPPALAALPARGPLLAIAHGGDVHLLARARLLAPALGLLAARRARLAFVSHDLRDRALAACPRPLARLVAAASCVQPMGLDGARFAAVARRRRPAAPPTIAVLARLVPIKGVAVAIDALRHLRTPARLVVAGDGPLAAALRARAAGLPVALVGALDAAGVDDLLASAAVVVVPSLATAGGRREGMPLAALEALAAGVPLVATATGGLAELPTDAAWQVAPGDPVALARAIDEALAAPPRAAAAAVARGLDWSAVGASLWAHWVA
jgi:glycosyltransferase involved in cell wall biosynthesis